MRRIRLKLFSKNTMLRDSYLSFNAPNDYPSEAKFATINNNVMSCRYATGSDLTPHCRGHYQPAVAGLDPLLTDAAEVYPVD